ncbi:MAG: response regulator [Salinibacter sp.]
MNTDSSGTVWAGSLSGVYRISKSSTTQWTAQERFTDKEVFSISWDDTGSLWFGGARVYRRRGERLRRIQLQEGRSRTHVRAISTDPRGALWIGGRSSGLFRYHEEKLRELLPPDSLYAPILALHWDSENTLWIGTGVNGVGRYRNGSVTWYGTDDGVPYDRVRDVHETRDGTIWVATYGGGIARFDDGASGASFEPVTPKEGLPSGAIHAIHEAPEGIFWMTSNKGVFRVSRAQVEAVADGRRERVYVQTFGTEDGMPAREANGNFQPAIAEDPSGRLWIPTISGLTFVDSNDPRLTVLESIPIRISGVRVDGMSRPPDSLRLSPSSYRLAIDFGATSLRHAEDLSFRYRLNGGDWTPARRRHTAEFTALDAGTHTFEVQATLNGETWYVLSTPLRFTVAPHFYETGWFRLLVLLGLCGLLGGAYFWRTRALRRRQEKLRRMVDDRTEQLVEEKKKTEAQAERLEALDAEKNRFFANISHELRTPLTILKGTSQDLLDGTFGELPSPAQRQVEIMRTNVRRLHRLTDQLLDLSRLETTDPELNEEPTELVTYLRQTVRSFIPLAERRGLDLHLETTIDTHPCQVDPEKLETIVGNLLSNALQNTPEGGDVRVTLDVEDADPPVTVLRVADTGRGIAPERQDEVFERFTHAGREDIDRSATGIGLSLVREYVDLHGGTIALDSTPGEGSIFTVRLPLPPADAAAVESSGRSEPDEASQNAPRNEPRPAGGDGVLEDDDRPIVLVVEDNADVRAYLRRHLSDTYHVVEANTGADGLDTARKIDPDLVLADLMMPEMDGTELCRQIRDDSDLARTPVVLLTARAAEEDAVAGLEAGADAYVTKPFSMTELKARLRRLLNAHWTGSVSAPSTADLVPDAEVTSADEEFLSQVADAIDEHLSHSNFTVDDLAAEVGLSSRQLQRKLKRLTDTSPAAFIRQYRLDIAAELLEEDAGTVSEVAYEVGFGTPETFSRRFKERFGCPPSEYATGSQVDAD